MTKKQILNRLIKIGKTGSGRGPWVVADLIHQEDLFDIQEAFNSLVGDLATDIGNDGIDKITKAFPYLFSTEPAGG